MLPVSTSRSPTRPAIGASTRVLRHQRLLRLELLVGHERLRMEIPRTFEIAAGGFQLRGILLQLALGLCEANPIRRGIDLREQLTALNPLALHKRHAHQLAVDTRFHRDGVQRRNGTDRLDVDGQVLRLCHDRAHGDERRLFRAGPGGLRVAVLGRNGAERKIPSGHGHAEHHRDIKRPAGARTGKGRSRHRQVRRTRGEKAANFGLSPRTLYRYSARVSTRQSSCPLARRAKTGGRYWTRTNDPLRVKQVL
jgi:hypothetical protein